MEVTRNLGGKTVIDCRWHSGTSGLNPDEKKAIQGCEHRLADDANYYFCSYAVVINGGHCPVFGIIDQLNAKNS